MDKLVTELEQLTQQGLADLAMMDAERLGDFMEQRSKLILGLIQAAESTTAREKDTYKARIQSVLNLDPIFLKKLEYFRDEASSQLAKLERGKTQRNAYDTHYDGESIFFDRKK